MTSPAGGMAEREGVRLAWARHGDRGRHVLLMPTWSIVHSRVWKAQVPYLARHFRVTTFDGRGSGRSDRPSGAAAYAEAEYAADTVAVMDAAGIDRAVLVGLSRGASWAVQVAADHPERVAGLVAIAPACRFADDPQPDPHPWDVRHDSHHGWKKSNRHYWQSGPAAYDDFLRFFFSRMFNEAHSTKQIEDAVAWGRETPPEVLVATTAAQLGLDGAPPREPLDGWCARVRCPVLVLHGTGDAVRPTAVGERLAAATGGELVLLEGAGHGPPMRDPVHVNHEIRRFVERVAGHPEPQSQPQPQVQPRPRRWTRSLDRPRRVLYLSSPIGLGHARRDLAIADELRTLHPDLRIDWLAQDPVTRLLSARGETVHPASAALVSESAHIEAESGEHDLHAFQAIRRMDEILVSNFHVFDDLTEREHYDLVVADEAWEVDHFLHENPELKRSPYAWLTDFVGWLPMPEGGPGEAALTADYNAEMISHRERFRALRDRSLFVGNAEDVVDADFGPGLPRIADWTARNFAFAGYVTGFAPIDPETRADLRRRFGHRPDERVCVVAAGGSGVGLPFLSRVAEAVPELRRRVPDLRVVLVTGPRIDPARISSRPGLEVVGFVPDLHLHLAACDVAVVQGGLTTCMELTANGRPFVYVPLRGHFEQNLHVRHRLQRYRAGRCLDYDRACDPGELADAVAAQLAAPVDYLPVETDGASRAARLLSDLL